jgi:hypothetical protein
MLTTDQEQMMERVRNFAQREPDRRSPSATAPAAFWLTWCGRGAAGDWPRTGSACTLMRWVSSAGHLSG